MLIFPGGFAYMLSVFLAMLLIFLAVLFICGRFSLRFCLYFLTLLPTCCRFSWRICLSVFFCVVAFPGDFAYSWSAFLVAFFIFGRFPLWCCLYFLAVLLICCRFSWRCCLYSWRFCLYVVGFPGDFAYISVF